MYLQAIQGTEILRVFDGNIRISFSTWGRVGVGFCRRFSHGSHFCTISLEYPLTRAPQITARMISGNRSENSTRKNK